METHLEGEELSRRRVHNSDSATLTLALGCDTAHHVRCRCVASSTRA